MESLRKSRDGNTLLQRASKNFGEVSLWRGEDCSRPPSIVALFNPLTLVNPFECASVTLRRIAKTGKTYEIRAEF